MSLTNKTNKRNLSKSPNTFKSSNTIYKHDYSLNKNLDYILKNNLLKEDYDYISDVKNIDEIHKLLNYLVIINNKDDINEEDLTYNNEFLFDDDRNNFLKFFKDYKEKDKDTELIKELIINKIIEKYLIKTKIYITGDRRININVDDNENHRKNYIRFLFMILNISDNIFRNFKDTNRIFKLNKLSSFLKMFENMDNTGFMYLKDYKNNNDKLLKDLLYNFYNHSLNLNNLKNESKLVKKVMIDSYYNEKDERYRSFYTLSNSFISELIDIYEFILEYNSKKIKKPKITNGGKKTPNNKESKKNKKEHKIYIGPKGGKYIIKIIDGIKVKKYITDK